MANQNIAPKAEFRDIEYGGAPLEVLRHEGEYYVAVPSMADRKLISSKNAARDVKAIVGKNSNFFKFQTDRARRAVGAIALKDFKQVIRALDRKGVPAASALLDALLDIALETVADAAFGQDTKAETVLAKLPEYFERNMVAQRSLDSSDPVVRHLAQFTLTNPDYEVVCYEIP